MISAMFFFLGSGGSRPLLYLIFFIYLVTEMLILKTDLCGKEKFNAGHSRVSSVHQRFLLRFRFYPLEE